MNNICLLVYTHSEYAFMWKAMIPLLQKHVENIDIHWLYEELADQTLIDQMVPTNLYKHTYNINLIWTKRVLKALNEIHESYILFLHEDWLPIGKIDINILNNMIKFMKEKNCGFLLSYSHISVTSCQEGIFTGYEDYYFYSEKNHIFQPAIWNKKVFEEFCVLNKRKDQNEDRDCLNLDKNIL